jgi:hypothetical protein
LFFVIKKIKKYKNLSITIEKLSKKLPHIHDWQIERIRICYENDELRKVNVSASVGLALAGHVFQDCQGLSEALCSEGHEVGGESGHEFDRFETLQQLFGRSERASIN